MCRKYDYVRVAFEKKTLKKRGFELFLKPAEKQRETDAELKVDRETGKRNLDSRKLLSFQ